MRVVRAAAAAKTASGSGAVPPHVIHVHWMPARSAATMPSMSFGTFVPATWTPTPRFFIVSSIPASWGCWGG
jgi:hypothetical protein